MMLTKQEVIEGLKYHNEWRRGAETIMMDPSDIGELIDGAIALLEQSDNSGDEQEMKADKEKTE